MLTFFDTPFDKLLFFFTFTFLYLYQLRQTTKQACNLITLSYWTCVPLGRGRRDMGGGSWLMDAQVHRLVGFELLEGGKI